MMITGQRNCSPISNDMPAIFEHFGKFLRVASAVNEAEIHYY